jgi:hypothetical protein
MASPVAFWQTLSHVFEASELICLVSSTMTYNKLSKEIEQLHYRDKFRLAQLLIQMARKEEAPEQKASN